MSAANAIAGNSPHPVMPQSKLPPETRRLAVFSHIHHHLKSIPLLDIKADLYGRL
jgi:hypothetical protein